LIAGTLAPTAGHIRFDGRDLASIPPQGRCRAGIARTHQVPQPFEKLTVFENLLVGAVYGRQRSEREAAQYCGEILDRLGLLRRANALAGSLTLLERKRLEMARALATAPQLLLLDEIAGGLTEGECVELVATISDIRKTGVAILWIEHVVHALLAVVDRLVVLNFGRKIAEGLPREVMQRPDVHQIYIGIEA
jgi:branched-chain amino acid transport system ATP-binding protein